MSVHRRRLLGRRELWSRLERSAGGRRARDAEAPRGHALAAHADADAIEPGRLGGHAERQPEAAVPARAVAPYRHAGEGHADARASRKAVTAEHHAGTRGGGRAGEGQTRLGGRARRRCGAEDGDRDDCERPYSHAAEDRTCSPDRLGAEVAVAKEGGAMSR